MKTILIVDDIFMNRLLLREIAKKMNLQCLEAPNGKEAIEILRREEVDVVLMDIEMPVMNGLETTQYIREHMPQPKRGVPVVAITAHAPSEFIESYHNIGFTQFMSKPYSIDKMMQVLSEIDGRAGLQSNNQ
ncbi:MAG: response regulator [Bacteroidales bacterium]|nr:response regulator [Bacteroidales bacterium]